MNCSDVEKCFSICSFSITGKRWDIRIKLKPKCRNCVVLWTGQKNSLVRGDYLFVGIDSKGCMYASYDLGGGPVNITYRHVFFNAQKWYTLRIHR